MFVARLALRIVRRSSGSGGAFVKSEWGLQYCGDV